MKATKSNSNSSGTRPATLHIFGGFELRDSDGHIIELKARKSRQLLAYLAIPPNQTRTREQLATLLWSDRQEEQARGSLRTALSGIRHALAEDALIVENDLVRLRPGYLETDFDNLKRLSNDDDTIISEMANFYTGEILAGLEHDSELFMDWLRGLRIETVDLAIAVLEKSADRYSKMGDHKSAIKLMRDSLSLEPLKEKTHRTIMRLYADSGEKAMALAQFRTCKEVLLHELGAGPDPKTQALADSIALRDVSVSEELRGQASINSKSLSRDVSPSHPQSISHHSALHAKASIAVLPFVNMSGDAEQIYFADGITEDIITDLFAVDGLSVAPKSSSQIYRGAEISTQQIASEIGVNYLLVGSVRKFGDDVRISAQLIDAVQNSQLWAERFDRKLDNIFELQSEISGTIVEALKLNFPSTTGSSAFRRGTDNVEAYELYLRARKLMDEFTEPATALAKYLFDQSITADPGFALAYTGYSDSIIREISAYNADPKLVEEAIKSCEMAEKIAPNLAELYRTKGGIATFFGNGREAEEHLLKAIQLDPNSALTYSRLGMCYIMTERDKDLAYQAYKKSFELEPENIANNGMFMMYLRDCSQSEQKLYGTQLLNIAKKRISLNPFHFDATTLAASAALLLGDHDEAFRWLRFASSFALSDSRAMYNLACTYAVMGKTEEAIDQLIQALDVGLSDAQIKFMKSADPELDSIRNNPRFAKLLESR